MRRSQLRKNRIAALYVQGFQDPVLLDAVDDVEDLTAGFSRKIWQKITILENLRRALHGGSSVAGDERSRKVDTDLA